jgi:hypothetical protein
MLGKSEQWVRDSVIQNPGLLGIAVKGSGKYSFHISPHKLADYMGKQI